MNTLNLDPLRSVISPHWFLLKLLNKFAIVGRIAVDKKENISAGILLERPKKILDRLIFVPAKSYSDATTRRWDRLPDELNQRQFQ
jgi:hypothetical protein